MANMNLERTLLTQSSVESSGPPARVQKALRRYHSLIVFPCSMKQIPFMVPQHTCTTPPALRHNRSEEETYASEPSSPGSKRPSVEIPGKIHVCL